MPAPRALPAARAAAALDRIDRVLDRLEADRRAAAALALRHDRLRAATGEAVAGIDRMIDGAVASGPA